MHPWFGISRDRLQIKFDSKTRYLELFLDVKISFFENIHSYLNELGEFK
tara:strand:+ start:164 stop:310 length:147 start_codon:yes stop_codon:yes gene_type:complete